MTQQTSTLEQRVLGRALRMKLCPCLARGGAVCFACAPRPDSHVVIHGAACLNKCSEEGQVAEFPMLRGPCPCLSGTGHCEGCLIGDAQVIAILGPAAPPAHPDEYCKPPCIPCQGRGWIPVTTTDALLEAILSLGFQPRIRKHLSQYETCLYQGRYQTPWGDSGDAQNTLEGALVAALEVVLSSSWGVEEVLDATS